MSLLLHDAAVWDTIDSRTIQDFVPEVGTIHVKLRSAQPLTIGAL